MLSLIPAFLLLAFQGPAALERLGHEGRLPTALRELNRGLTVSESGVEDRDGERAKRAFAELAALTADARFSAAVAQLLGFDSFSLESDDAHRSGQFADPEQPTLPKVHSDPKAKLQEGFFVNRRTRDGPIR